MTPEQEREIREWETCGAGLRCGDYVKLLLAEIDRLRAEVEAAHAFNVKHTTMQLMAAAPLAPTDEQLYSLHNRYVAAAVATPYHDPAANGSKLIAVNRAAAIAAWDYVVSQVVKP